MSSAEARFGELVARLLDQPAVTPPDSGRGRFGSNGLKVNGKIFAMLVGGRLVVRLPKARVDALVASGDGERYDPRHDGRLMREWLVLNESSAVDWLQTATQALQFTRSKR
jgi:TfoX/Sxy family transcriptional regulator of competence genes